MSFEDIRAMRSVLDRLVLETARQIERTTPFGRVSVQVEDEVPRDATASHPRSAPADRACSTAPTRQKDATIPILLGPAPSPTPPHTPDRSAQHTQENTAVPVSPASVPTVQEGPDSEATQRVDSQPTALLLLPSPAEALAELSPAPKVTEVKHFEIGDLDDLPPCRWCHRKEWRIRKDGLPICVCYFEEEACSGGSGTISALPVRPAA